MSTPRQRAWLFGPIPDLLFGSGLLYFAVLGVLIFGGATAQGAIPYRLFAYAILIISGAHYGATLLRVYEHEAERRTYRNFTLHMTLVMIGLLMAAVHSPLWGSVFITIYLTWSPWHYSGQNYGIAMMMLRRRGVDPPPAARRALHWSFYLSFAALLLNFHFEGGLGSADPLGYAATDGSGYAFVSLELPGSLRGVLMPVVGAAYLASLVAAFGLLWRTGARKELAPTALVVVLQAAWFSIPHLGYYFAIGENIPVLNLRTGANFQSYFVWVALGHASQYLWITAYYARSDPRWPGFGRYLGKTFAFGNAVWAAPVFLMAPDWFRGADYEGGLAMCVAAAVNLHHFILDGAIWKLRNPKVAGVLLRRDANDGTPEARPTASPWKGRLAWGLAALFCFLKFFPEHELETRFPDALARRDHEDAGHILDRASWYGRDSASLRTQLANQMVQLNRGREALPHYWRALELEPSAHGFAAVGDLTARTVGPRQSLFTYQTGIDQFPEDATLHQRKATALVRLKRLDEALPLLERAAELSPEDEAVRKALDDLREQLHPRAAG